MNLNLVNKEILASTKSPFLVFFALGCHAPSCCLYVVLEYILSLA